MEDRSGKVQTVLGYIDPSCLGVTHTHEHLSMDYSIMHTEAPLKDDAGKENMPFSLELSGWIRQYPFSHKPNLLFCEEHDAVIDEIRYFKENGGGTIVDNTTIGIKRDIEFSKRVSLETGVNIIHGAGYYIGYCQPPNMDKKSVEELTEEMIREVTIGCDGTDIKCGVIGEIGCSFPLQANEKKCLQAAAMAQIQTGVGIIIHPGRSIQSMFDIVRVLQEAGGDISKTVMSHLDRTIDDYGKLAEFAQLGTYLEYDLFGLDTAYYAFNPRYFIPNDGERVNRIKFLVDLGFEDRIVISHDLHTKHRLTKFGGHGYSHILRSVVPLMKQKDISQTTIDKFLIHNPKAFLTIK